VGVIFAFKVGKIFLNSSNPRLVKLDGFVKSPLTVMPDLIRHPEPVEFTGFWLSPE
jgi:hypothetical protein